MGILAASTFGVAGMSAFAHALITGLQRLPLLALGRHVTVPDRPRMFLAWKRARSTDRNPNTVNSSAAGQATGQKAGKQVGGGRIK